MSALQTQVMTLQTANTALQTQVATLQTANAALQTQVTTLQSNTTTLQAALSAETAARTAGDAAGALDLAALADEIDAVGTVGETYEVTVRSTFLGQRPAGHVGGARGRAGWALSGAGEDHCQKRRQRRRLALPSPEEQ